VTTDLASISARFGALLVDWILCLLLARIAGPLDQWAWLPSVLLILEYGVFVGFFGQTPGMRLARIRVISVHDSKPIGPLAAVLRGFLLALLVPALIIDEYRRGLHDRAAGSVVVKAD
jgi:uncharacterized RDD family membrane protein YckC